MRERLSMSSREQAHSMLSHATMVLSDGRLRGGGGVIRPRKRNACTHKARSPGLQVLVCVPT